MSRRTMVSFMLWAAAVLLVSGTRLANPDKTETRLFVDHWPIWLAASVLLLIGALTWERAK